MLQRLDRLANVRVETRSASFKMCTDVAAHARIPEFLDMFGDARDCLVVALALEEFADLVGHVD
jgi:hypothetical protein